MSEFSSASLKEELAPSPRVEEIDEEMPGLVDITSASTMASTSKSMEGLTVNDMKEVAVTSSSSTKTKISKGKELSHDSGFKPYGTAHQYTAQELLELHNRQLLEKQVRKQNKQVEDASKDHKFWYTQPVPKFDESFEENCPMNPDMLVEQVRQEPYAIPEGFTWCTMDMKSAAERTEAYTLLFENYVEDDDSTFRFDYSEAFLDWALTPPGYHKNWIVGVRNAKNNKLMAFITAVPALVSIHGSEQHMAEINFLCVHKKLRSKRLTPVLIKEITRRVNLLGRWQAVYTAGVVLPRPVSKCRYYHRTLNPKKLVEIGFCRLPTTMTMASYMNSLKLPDSPSSDYHALEPDDVHGVTVLLNTYLASKKLHAVFTAEEAAHMLLPRRKVVNAYVLRNSKGEVTDLCSFYHLPSTVLKNAKHTHLSAVYSFYNVATTLPFDTLMRDALVLARNENADVFNALDVMDNATVFGPLQFGAGDGFLQYYLYNWKCPIIQASDVGLVLL